jgi:hypothetical protein
VPAADLPAVIQALLRPGAYPHPVQRVELRQTHISFVLLAGDYAYKVKKAVDFGFLDYSTLAKRRFYCRQEVALNSRLCSGTYLGVVPIREEAGRITIAGAGRTVEYAVQMRRLPAERMMDRLLAEGLVTEEMVRNLARVLAGFHARAETNARIATIGLKGIRYAWEENFRQWQPFIGQTLSPEQDVALRAFGQRFFASKAALLAARAEAGRVRDCHGDLRSDSVCFVDGLCIYDCIEFNRRFRYTDVAGDVGFLAMDLDYRGHPELSAAFQDEYVRASGDTGLLEVIDFFKCYRAAVRGKVEGFLLAQPEVPAAEKRRARSAAKRYFHLACQYARTYAPPFLIITCGLSATGKSTLARALGEKTGAEVVSSDVVRKRLAGLEPLQRREEAFGHGIYGPEFTERTYAALLEAARGALDAGRSVILDATYLRRAHRRQARRLAEELGAQFACVYLTAEDSLVRRRIEKRLQAGADPSDAGWSVYVRQKRRFQRPKEVPQERLIAVDAARPVASQVRTVLGALRRLSPHSAP